MFLIPLKLNLLKTVDLIELVLLLMLITSMELTEKSNPLEIEKSSISIEPRDVILSPPNLNHLLVITKKSNKKP